VKGQSKIDKGLDCKTARQKKSEARLQDKNKELHN